MKKNLEGKAWKFGDNIDTDIIIPVKWCNSFRIEELAPHAMEGVFPDFAQTISKGDIIIGGQNFGCGSSRENAPIAILGTGIGAIVAISFARIFFRNSINIGLPIFESKDAALDAKDGHIFEINPAKGLIINKTLSKEYTFAPYPKEIQDIINAGGMIEFVKRSLKNGR